MKAIIAFIKWLVSVLFKIEITGENNIPSDGACIVCMNHISLFDPIVIYCYMTRNIRFIGKAELMKIPVLSGILKAMKVIPIKRGTGDIGAVKASLKALKDGEALGIFPTGTREKKNPNAPVKSGTALMATKANVPVIPININSTYKIFSKVKITVGECVDLSAYTGRKLTQEELALASSKIYDSIKALGDKK